MRAHILSAALLTAIALAPACEDDQESGSDGGVEKTEGAYLPWKEGNTWTYRVTNNGEVSMKVTTIGPEEEVGGTGPNATKRAHRVVTKKGELDQTISWQALEGDRVVRYREQSFHATTGELELEEHWAPHKLHFDESQEHTSEGASWLEVYDETKIPVDGDEQTAQTRDRWSVDSPSEEVTVPAGTFNAIVMQKASGSGQKTYWYVPGVGKVRESGGQLEELVSYEVAK